MGLVMVKANVRGQGMHDVSECAHKDNTAVQHKIVCVFLTRCYVNH